MKIIVLGAGKVGSQIIQTLADDGHQVVLIENNRSKAARISTRVDCQVIIDEGTQKEVLIAADVEHADYFIAATNLDEVNLITCSIAKKLSSKIQCIGRIRGKAYLKNIKDLDVVFNVDYVVCPEREAALSIIRSIEYGGGVSDVFTFKDFKRMIMRNFIVTTHSPLIGQPLKNVMTAMNVPVHFAGKFLVALVNRQGKSIIPYGDLVIQQDDELFIIALHDILDMLYSHLGKHSKEAKAIRKIIIIGASEVSKQIVDCYVNTQGNDLANLVGKRRFANRDITVVESDIEKCKAFSEIFYDITILNIDVSEEDVLKEIEISSSDMVIAATDSQELNIVVAAHSHILGVKHTIALVGSPTYLEIAHELGIGLALNVKNVVSESITAYLRGARSLYSIVDGSYEIFKTEVSENSPAAFAKVSDLKLPDNSLLLCIQSVRHGTIIATGNTVLEPNDILLCISPYEFSEKTQRYFSPPKKKLKDT